jgi:hypothetical protein
MYSNLHIFSMFPIAYHNISITQFHNTKAISFIIFKLSIVYIFTRRPFQSYSLFIAYIKIFSCPWSNIFFTLRALMPNNTNILVDNYNTIWVFANINFNYWYIKIGEYMYNLICKYLWIKRWCRRIRR